jgi:hypothetical protein
MLINNRKTGTLVRFEMMKNGPGLSSPAGQPLARVRVNDRLDTARDTPF